MTPAVALHFAAAGVVFGPRRHPSAVGLLLHGGVLRTIELERRVLDGDVEVLRHAVLEVGEDLRSVPVVEALVGEHDVRSEHRKVRVDPRDVEVVDLFDVVDVLDVLPDIVEIELLGGGLEQDRPGLTEDREGARNDERGDEEGRDGIGPRPVEEPDRDRGDDDADRAERIGDDLEERRSEVE